MSIECGKCGSDLFVNSIGDFKCIACEHRAEISDLRKQLAESQAWVKRHESAIEWQKLAINERDRKLSECENLLLEIHKNMSLCPDEFEAWICNSWISDPRWPSDSSSRSSTKEEPKI